MQRSFVQSSLARCTRTSRPTKTATQRLGKAEVRSRAWWWGVLVSCGNYDKVQVGVGCNRYLARHIRGPYLCGSWHSTL